MANDGSDELARFAADLTRASATVTTRAALAMEKTLADISAGARNRAPVDTGNLKSSITHEVHRAGSTIEGEVGPTAKYGRYVEEGTSRQRAQPYLRPATDATVPGYEAALAQLGADLIEGT